MSETESQPYQVMPDLNDEEYERLKQDIAENGVEYPIIVDTDGEIIDGHHRYQAWTDLGRDPEDLPRRVVDGTDTENYHRAYRTNLNRRDLTDGTKREVVKQYLLEHPDRVAEDTQQEIAADLGIGQSTVDRAVADLRECGKLTQVGELSTSERRDAVREYVESNPAASNREVAREVNCDVSHPTVGNWRDEWDAEEPTTGLDTFTNSQSEAEAAADVAETATDEGTDETVRETARENAERLTEGNTSPTTASKNVEQAQAADAVADQRDTDTTDATIHRETATSFIDELNAPVDLLLTDPPYSTDVGDVTRFARSWVPDALTAVASDGFAFIFVGAYPDELQAYLNVVEHTSSWEVCQVLVWTYRNTLGRAPTDRYKLNWQAILYLRGPDAPALDAPKTSEQWAVHDVNAPDGRFGERHHKWEKPTELADRLIRHTTAEGDTVLDPFAGTGTFPIAAAELGREAMACDCDEEMLDLAAQRGCEIDDD